MAERFDGIGLAMADPTDPISAAAGAVQEVAKTTGKAIDVGRDVGAWVDSVLGEPLREAIGWAITDSLRGRREEAQVRRAARLRILAHETEQLLRLKGVESVRTPSDKILEPLIEAAGREDDEAIQKLWASLLASTLSDAEELDRGFVTILGELSKADAEAFSGVYTSQHASWHRDVRVSRHQLFSWRKLFRLGLIEPSPEQVMLPKDIHRTFEQGKVEVVNMNLPGSLERVRLTETGRIFGAVVGIERMVKSAGGGAG